MTGVSTRCGVALPAHPTITANTATLKGKFKAQYSNGLYANKTIYENVNKRFGSQAWNLWLNWTIWDIASAPDVHGVYGPDFPGGEKPFPGLATGHPVSGMWVAKG